MRIGVDFGTSFCSAAVMVNGQVQHIQFDQSLQFRTAVFFPDRYVPDSEFSLTVKDERQIESAVRNQISRYGEQLAIYDERLAELVREEKRSKAQGDPYTDEQKSGRRALLVKPKHIADEDVRQSTHNAIKRRWRELQEQVTSQEGLNLRQASGIFGEEAIEALYNQEKGRIFQSPKSMLGFNLDPGHQEVVVGVIAQVLKHIRVTASRQLGSDITAVTLGRPVEFRGLQGTHDDAAVQRLLERAALEAGFTDVDFLEEPSAAAYSHHCASPLAHAVLVIDVGGGTTDVAYGTVGGDALHPSIHQTWGWAHGGTDVDVELSVRAAMPWFGKDAPHGLPLSVYRDAAKVSNLVAQQGFTRRSLLGVSPHFVSRLERLRSSGVTVMLNRDVEELKVELSEQPSASRHLDYIERELLVRAERKDLEVSLGSFMTRFRAFLEQVRDQLPKAGVTVFMAGGMSRAPYVQQLVRDVFPLSEVVMGDASYGVVNGLAQAAQAKSCPERSNAAGEDIDVNDRKERFLAGMALADRFANRYQQALEAFGRQYEVQQDIFAGTTLGDYLRLLEDKVGDAAELNRSAGWLPYRDRFTEQEFLESLIRRDRRGRRYKTLADIPEFLREEFEDLDNEASFTAYFSDMREECRSAYSGMRELREEIEDEPDGVDLLAALDGWPEQAHESKVTIKEATALSDNLHRSWQRCQKAGLALLCMANQFGDDDLDHDLADELMD